MAEPTAPPVTSEINLYPKLPLADQGDNFRLGQIAKIKSDLQTELDKRNKTRGKYKTAYSSVHRVGMTLGTLSTLAGGGSVVTALSGVGIPVAVPLGVFAGVCGATGLGLSQTNKWLLRKLEKHDSLLALTQAKLSSVNTLISRALNDNSVNSDEYEYILKQLDDFYAQKMVYQAKHRQRGIQAEPDQKKLIEKGRIQGLHEAKQALIEKVN